MRAVQEKHRSSINYLPTGARCKRQHEAQLSTSESRKSPIMMSIMIIATVMIMAMIYAVRFVGCFALILTFLPAAFCVSLAKPPRNSLNGRTFWPTLAASSVFR